MSIQKFADKFVIGKEHVAEVLKKIKKTFCIGTTKTP